MDKEYIEREAVLELLSEVPLWKECAPLLLSKMHLPLTSAFKKLQNNINSLPAADVAPVRHGHWTGMEGDVCSECYRSLTEIMDADSYFAIGFDPSDLVACPFCGALMDGGNKNE